MSDVPEIEGRDLVKIVKGDVDVLTFFVLHLTFHRYVIFMKHAGLEDGTEVVAHRLEMYVEKAGNFMLLALGEPGTFMTQDVNIIQTQIEQRLPWIKQVSVRKQWPDELKIHLVEYVPIARWNDQHMVDAEGNTFSVPPDRTSKQVLPMLYGPEGSANEVLQGYREMGQMLAKDRFTLKEAAMTARRSWQLTLNNDIKLNLGRGDTMKRLARFVELYPVLQQQAQTDGKRISYVDLRYDSGAAVGWAPLPPEESTQQQNQAQAEQQ